jgi:exonuclease VII large subunit
LGEPVVIAWARCLATSQFSQMLHEGLICTGGQFHGQEVMPYQEDELYSLLEENYRFPSISVELGDQLRRLFPVHKKQLLELIAAREKTEQARLAELAEQRAEEEAEALTQLMNERIKELRTRIRSQNDRIPAGQLQLFDRNEYLQYQEDMRWLERKLEDLQTRKKEEPEIARQRYDLRSVRVFPLGLLYLLPESLVD